MAHRITAPRRTFLGMAAAQWVILLTSLAVVTGMVSVAEMARQDADRHRRAQVLAERVRAAGQRISAIRWESQATAQSETGNASPVSSGVVAMGFAAYRELSSALDELHALEPNAKTESLQQDGRALYAAGLQTLAAVNAERQIDARKRRLEQFHAILVRLDRDATLETIRQADVAGAALRRSRTGSLASLLAGLLALLVLGLRFARLRRSASTAAEVRRTERRAEERVRALVEHSSDVVTVIDRELAIRWQGASVRRLLGHDAADLLGRPLTSIVHPDDVRSLERFVIRSTERSGGATANVRVRHADNGWRHLEVIAEDRLYDPAVQGIVLNMRDVTERKALEDELRHQAFHDALTGLANRALFEDRLGHARAAALRDGSLFAVLFLDLDDFKTINDSLGHATGDLLLRSVAERVSGALRPSDTAARLGGDEFAVLLEGLPDAAHARRVAERMLRAVAPPVRVAGRELTVTGSIGVALSDGGDSVDELLSNADMAMYAAKGHGKDGVETYESSMHSRAVDRLELGGELARAVDDGQFELDYQPIVELGTGEVLGVEALVRWQHPERGRLAPGHFIPLAEETGAIVALGAWILRAACEQAHAWHAVAPERDRVTMSVNVSTKQLREPAFPAVVAGILDDTGVHPQSIVLEITESLLVEDRPAMIAQLERLRDLGVRLAVDDFGTGYSVLSHLQQFPLDLLKIDKSFVDGIAEDPAKADLLCGIITLGASLHLRVVVEGIEHDAQARRLRDVPGLLAQGFLFSRPVGPDAMGDRLAGAARRAA